MDTTDEWIKESRKYEREEKLREKKDPTNTRGFWMRDENGKIHKNPPAMLPDINKIPFTTKENTIAGIYVVRDPRNVVTSISNHYQIDFDQSIKLSLIHI